MFPFDHTFHPAILRSESSKADSHSTWRAETSCEIGWQMKCQEKCLFLKMLDKICVTDVDWMIDQFFFSKKIRFFCNLSGALFKSVGGSSQVHLQGLEGRFRELEEVLLSQGRWRQRRAGPVLDSKIQWFEPIKSL